MANVGNNTYNYKHISSAATTNVHQTGPVLLHSLCVNTGATGTVTVLDGTTATDTSRATVAVVDSNTNQEKKYDVILSRGLVVVTDSAADLTISYVTI
jgi:hypothetical protein